ncbi:hypothetical protein GCM10025734_80730 [Kitasatospora paranensis]|uniref:hypothetical protein n=1 Tax=Kitasatospora paranensis TaxID=258053 RepID=UPI0031EF7E3C
MGRGSADGHLQRLDLAYGAEHTVGVQVTTQRRLPEHVRVFSTLEPDALLSEFLFQHSSPDGPVCPPWVLTSGPGHLVVDGTGVEAQRLAYGDHLVSLAVVGEETVAVVSAAALHDEAVHLTFDTTALQA